MPDRTEADKDTARLNWLEKHLEASEDHNLYFSGIRWVITTIDEYGNSEDYDGESSREAIDAAMDAKEEASDG